MFTSSLFEKGCSATSENSSSTRGVSVSSNSSPTNRFPVGIPSPGDDNQNVRIQLAVHKYNNSLPGSPSTSRRSLMSPLRHSFFKNMHKPMGYEGESDHLLNHQHHHYHQGSPRNENRYEGVGNFPTVHLKKSSVLYRPIRRLKEVKVPYPELPVNRFMNYTPEYCMDTKSSPRSVLDVLQDMSRKKIHSKDESDYPRYTSRGLGGDLPVNEETLCRPLFVQKPIQNVISKRDNTTQTFSSQRSDRSSVASSASCTKLDTPDPRAELRRKLARQNNEIFASLSSSLTSTFALKRKIDKISGVKGDRQGSDQSLTTVKKARLYDSSLSTSASSVGSKADAVSNGVKNASGYGTVSTPVLRVTRNERLGEGGSTATSPSKDRLTTIYLDMESSTSPKAQIFQKNLVDEDNTGIPNGSVGSKNTENLNFSTTVHFKTGAEHSFGKEADKGAAIDSGLPVSSNTKIDSAVISSIGSSTTTGSFSTTPSSSNQEFKLNSTSPINLNFNESTSSWAQSKSSTTFVQQFTTTATTPGTSTPKTTADANVTSESSSTVSKSNSQIGQFGVGQLTAGVSPPSSSLTLGGEIKKAETSSTTTFSIPTAITTTISQFAFGLNTVTTTSISAGTTKTTATLPTFGGLNQSCTTMTTLATNTNTSLFTFGQTTTSATSPAPFTITTSTNAATISQPVSVSGKPETPKSDFSLKFSTVSGSSGVTTCLGSSSQSVSFSEAPSAMKTTDKIEKDQDSGQSKGLGFLTQSGKTEISQSLKNTFPMFGVNSSTPASVNSSTAISSNVNTPVTSTSQSDKTTGFITSMTKEKSSSVTSTTDSVKVKPTMPFTFGQTSVSTTSTNPGGSTSGSIENSSGQNSQLKGFTFGQASSTQPSFTSTSSITATTSTQLSFTNTGFNFGTTTTQANVFGQSLTKSSTELKPLFGQAASQSTTNTLSQVPTFGQNSDTKEDKTKTSGVFGSVPGSSIIFGQNVKPASTVGTTFSGLTSMPPTSFGSSVAATAAATTTPFGGAGFQTTATFGAPSSTQTTVTFGAPKTTQAPITFGAPSMNSTNATATSTTSGSIFGTSTATQSAFSFGQSSTQVPTFGQSFNQNKTPSTSLSIPSTSIFGQNPTSTTGFVTSTSNTFSASGNQSLFGSKSESAEQNIFGQKSSTPAFGNSASSNQSFGSPNPLNFGLSSTTVQNGFQSSPPKSTDLPVFTFNAKPPNSTSGSAFSFGSTSSATGSTNSASFNINSSNNPFQFGSATAKEGFNSATSSPAFTFGAQQSNNILGNKAASSGTFSFGSNQGQPTGSTLNFGSTPSPSVFSFGSTGSTSGNSTFNFGTPQPGGPFGQTTPSPGFSVPGTFSIGSGSSSQSRPRASSRLRRRP